MVFFRSRARSEDASTPAPRDPLTDAQIRTAGAPVRVADARWAELLTFCEIREEDLRLLQDEREIADNIADAVGSLFELVVEFPALFGIVERNTTPERLGGLLGDHLASAFSGRVDQARVDRDVKIGAIHDRIDLPIMSFIAAQLRLDGVVVRQLVDRHSDDPQRLVKAIMAWRKVTTVDAAIVSQTFVDRRDRATEVLERVEQQTEGLVKQQEDLAAVAESVSATAEQSSASAEELSTAATAIGALAAEADRSMQGCVDLALGGERDADAAREAVAGMQTSVGEVSAALRELGEHTRRITGIVDTIGKIADQTNLLALNAAIEAARAGEHGRGFAVVADEVRKLADLTRTSLDDITALNTAALQAIDGVDGAIATTADDAKSVTERTEQARGRFSEIAGAIRSTAEELATIGSSVGQVVTASSDLEQSSASVATSAETLTGVTDVLARSIEEARALTHQS